MMMKKENLEEKNAEIRVRSLPEGTSSIIIMGMASLSIGTYDTTG
jgi:hypothetical protein